MPLILIYEIEKLEQKITITHSVSFS